MSGVLLDTNVVSELTRPAPDKRVVAYLRDLDRAFISAVTVHELQYGIARLPAGKRRNSLSRVVDRLLVEYEDAILPVGRHEAYRAGGLRAMEESGGRVLHLADAFFAATAPVNAPLVWPKSSDSSRSEGILEQFTTTKGSSVRGLASCIALATYSYFRLPLEKPGVLL